MQSYAAQLSSFLANAASPDNAAREQAEAGLKQAEGADWNGYITALAHELANEASPEVARQMAALVFKNALDAKDQAAKTEKAKKWIALDAERKSLIRQALLQTLQSKIAQAAHGAAMVIAKVAKVDLLMSAWPELLPAIHTHVAPESPELCRMYSLQCLGYICEEHIEVADQFPQQEINNMLTSIVKGMGNDQPVEVRLAATKALCDAIEFASMNFERREERNYLMEMICKTTICSDARVRLAAYQNLNKVADLQYKHLEQYIQTIYQLTTQSFKDESEEVAMQAIEFWTTLAEIEQLLAEDEEAAADSEVTCKQFVNRCAVELVKLLFQLLVQQDENQEDEDTDWNKCMSATVCLINVAKTAGDVIFDVCKAFIQEGVNRRSAPDDWRHREAAVTVFGCIVDGPDRAALLPLVNEAFSFMLTHGLSDPHVMVRRTTLWTLGRIFEYLHRPELSPPLVTQHNISAIVEAVLTSMKAEPGMAQKACYVLQALADGFSPEEDKHQLSPYFAHIVEALMQVAYVEVPSGVSGSLHVTAFEAMHSVIRHSAKESIELVIAMIPHLLQRIHETVQPGSSEQSMEDTARLALQRRHELQSQLCAALQVAIKRACSYRPVKQKVLDDHADTVMRAMLEVQNSRQTVIEEVVMTINVLCLEQGAAFSRYLPHVITLVKAGLQNHEDVAVCRACINTMGDLAREVMNHVVPYADEIILQLMTILRSDDLNRDIKPDILQVFGDMAAGLGPHFDRYVTQVVETLQAAMNVAYSNQMVYGGDADADEMLVSYNNELREAIVQAAAGIWGYLPDDLSQAPPATAHLLVPFGRNLLRFLSLIHNDDFADYTLLKDSIGLLGDLCGVPELLQEMNGQENKTWIAAFIQRNKKLPSTVLAYAETRLRHGGVLS